MKSIIKSTIKNSTAKFPNYAVFMGLFLLAGISCTAETPSMSTTIVEPVFEGMAPGYGQWEECVSFKDFSVRLTYERLDYHFEVFGGVECTTENRIVNQRLSSKSMLAGQWRQFLIIDNGTSLNSRSMVLFNPKNQTNKIEIDYVNNPIFKNNEIHFFSSINDNVGISDCSAQKEEFEEWLEFGLGAGLARKQVYNVEKDNISTLDETECYHIE